MYFYFVLKVEQLNRWTWHVGKKESIISIPSDEALAAQQVLTKKGQRHLDLHTQIFHVKYPVGGRKRPPKRAKPVHPKNIDPEQLFRAENQAEVDEIIRETGKLVHEENKARKRYLEHIAQQKIEEIKRRDPSKKIVVIEDKSKALNLAGTTVQVEKSKGKDAKKKKSKVK